jgi:hypothetical protein
MKVAMVQGRQSLGPLPDTLSCEAHYDLCSLQESQWCLPDRPVDQLMMMIIDYCKNLTAEPMRTLRSLSFVRLTFFEAAVVFRRSFAAASCFKKL